MTKPSRHGIALLICLVLSACSGRPKQDAAPAASASPLNEASAATADEAKAAEAAKPAAATPAPTGGGPLDCASSDNVYKGTCADGFLDDCFGDAGECDAETKPSNGAIEQQITFKNGAKLIARVLTEAKRVETQVIDGGGGVCASGSASMDPTPECVANERLERKDGTALSICAKEASLTVTCPDGSSFERERMAARRASVCIFGKQLSGCKAMQVGR